MSPQHVCGPDAGCDNECAGKAYAAHARAEALGAARRICENKPTAIAREADLFTVSGSLASALDPLIAYLNDHSADVPLMDDCEASIDLIRAIAKALGGPWWKARAPAPDEAKPGHWKLWVQRIASGEQAASEEQSREMARALLSRERERSAYLDANEEYEREMRRLLDRLIEISEVPCVKRWGTTPMKCLPKDRCTFCRTRELLAEAR